MKVKDASGSDMMVYVFDFSTPRRNHPRVADPLQSALCPDFRWGPLSLVMEMILSWSSSLPSLAP